MSPHQFVEPKDFHCFANDWQYKVDIFEAYSEYLSIFIDTLMQFSSMWDEYLGWFRIAKQNIKLLPNTKPVHLALSRVGRTVLQFQRPMLEKMLFQNVIELAQTKGAASVFNAPKKNGCHRLCVGYRKLKNLSRQDAYPTSRMNDDIESLVEATVFSKLHASSGYWQKHRRIPKYEHNYI